MSVRTRRPPALTFGTYQLLERLRGPSLTERHRALSADGRYVTLQVVRPELAKDFTFRSLFQVQAKKAQALTHPNIARIVDAGEADGRWYLAVEEVTGDDLASRLAAVHGRGERLPRRDVRAIVGDVGAALAYAHEQGVVHGDLRPGNVVLSTSGAAVVTGFVIARSLRTDDRIAVGAFAPAYMAPEQSTGKPPDQRTDIYALGVLTYELLTGRTPYASETPLAVLLAHGREPLPLPSHVEPRIGAPLERVLLRALAVDPAARHPDARSFIASLDEAFEEDARRPATAFVPVPAEARAVPPSAAAPWLRRPFALGVAGAGLLVAGVVLGALLRPVPAAPAIAAASVAVAPTAAATAPPTAAPRTPAPTPPPPPPTRQPATPVPPAVAPLARGQQLFAAKLDGSRELDDVHVFSGGAGDAAIRMTRGAIELEVTRARGGAEGFFPVPPRSSFAGEFVLTVPAGSQALMTWALRRDGDAAYLLRLDAATETLALVYDDGVRLREALAPQWRISGLRTGRSVSVTFRIDGADLSVQVDGAPALQARDARITRSALPPDIFVGDEGGVGLVRITAARLYAVP